uniref:Small ribosomal subunit protein mS33 n=1 Tax=Ditylenchus dipsaci TaxID=166011 RepID=A0A915D800_9BILA
MAGRYVASRIALNTRGLNSNTGYGKRMTFMSNKIFGEVTRKTNVVSMKVVDTMSQEPWEQREDKSIAYFSNQPMFHYLTKMLSLHGVFLEEHVLWAQVQDQLRTKEGKVVYPPPGSGKRAQLKAAKEKSTKK